ncbi:MULTISPECIES: hypothetical protein, partial [Enterobacteriaceae]
MKRLQAFKFQLRPG